MQLVLSFDNHIVRFVANCDMILNALTFDRWSMDNCRALIRTNSQPHNYQQLIAVCRHLWLIHSVIMSTKYAMSEFQLNFFGIFIRTSFSRLGQPVARWANVKSVIWLHSSKSIRSKYLQFYMKCERKAVVLHRKKNVEKYLLFLALGSLNRWIDDSRPPLMYSNIDCVGLTT